MKILAMTTCCVDVYPDTGKVFVGGNALNYAVQCVKSGAGKVAVLGAVGNDGYGELVKGYLETKPIDISHLHVVEGRTASNRIYISESGDRYFLPDSWDGGVYAEYRLTDEDLAFMNTFDLVAITSNEPNLKCIFNNLRGAVAISLDYLDNRDFDIMDELLPRTAISFISGDREVIERLRPMAARHGALIVVTLGAEGSFAIHGEKTYTMAAEPVDEVVDTTGCGDAYQAAFTVSYLRGSDILTAMKRGSEAAAKVLGHYGGVD